MQGDQIERYARHILLPDVGGIGQAALLASVASVDRDDPAGAIAARFLVASGVPLAAHGAPVELPPPPPWWPGAPGDADALAWWRGSTAATRWMADVIERAREPAIPLPAAMLDELRARARAASPDECCGYLVGDPLDTIVGCRNAQADGENPVAPERGPDTGFVIAGRELFDFARSFDTARPARVVYHSHPNHHAYFSATDHAAATAAGRPVYPVQHLVLAGDAAAIYVWSALHRAYVERWRTP